MLFKACNFLYKQLEIIIVHAIIIVQAIITIIEYTFKMNEYYEQGKNLRYRVSSQLSSLKKLSIMNTSCHTASPKIFFK